MIYQKTSIGQAEITAGQRSLNFRQRQVLIMVDGKRTLGDIAKLINQPNVPEIVAELASMAYVYDSSAPLPINTSHNTSQPTSLIKGSLINSSLVNGSQAKAETTTAEKPPLSDVQIETIKGILMRSTDQHLGIMGRPLKQKIEHAATEEQIITCTSQWHMAMRESKQGREFAGDLMEQIQQTLLFNEAA